jgi:hypothetical protein
VPKKRAGNSGSSRRSSASAAERDRIIRVENEVQFKNSRKARRDPGSRERA